MKAKIHIFQESRAIGNIGERLLLDLFPWGLRRGDGKTYDLISIPDDLRIEVKSDQHLFERGESLYPESGDSKRTSNFFIERWSSGQDGTLGGPWKARECDCALYIYVFIYELVAWSFRTQDLVCYLEGLARMPRLISVVNIAPGGGTYETQGYRLFRKSLVNSGIRMVGPILLGAEPSILRSLLSPART